MLNYGKILKFGVTSVAKFSWMKIDTASIMFTCLSSKKWGRTFRVSANLKTGDINPDLLKRAVSDLRPRFPSFYSTLKKGFFWNYQQCVTSLPEIREEHSKILLPITYRNDTTPDFRVLYHKNRIAIETAHHISDGKGMGEYFNALLERYVELCDNSEAEYAFEKVESTENAFTKHYIKGGEKADGSTIKAYQIEGTIEPGFVQLIFLYTPIEELLKKAKEKSMTVTEYVAAALILGTLRHAEKPIELPISIAIPVNLRRFFPTESLRNFTIQTDIVFEPKGRTDYTFDEVCDSIKGQLKKKLEKSELQKALNRYGSLTTNPVLRVVPNFIKLPVMRKMQHKSHAANTTILTNTGDSGMNESLRNRVERVEGVNGDTSGYGLISTCSALTYNGLFTMCFSVCSHDTSWPMHCVRALTELGLDVRIESTHGNGVRENEM